MKTCPFWAIAFWLVVSDGAGAMVDDGGPHCRESGCALWVRRLSMVAGQVTEGCGLVKP